MLQLIFVDLHVLMNYSVLQLCIRWKAVLLIETRTPRVKIAKFLLYYKSLAPTWKIIIWLQHGECLGCGIMWHEANLDPCSIVAAVTAPPTLAMLVFLDRLQS